MSRSLYEIDNEIGAILSAMESEGFDQDAVNAGLDAWLEENRDELREKVDRYCQVIASKTAIAKDRREEIKALSAMAQSDERTADTLEERLQAFFERIGCEKMETLHFKPRIQANGGVLPVILSDEVKADPRILPLECVEIRTIPDVEAIRKALEEGKEITGCSLGERGKHLRLR